jgi:1-acyl-sn-glycerol-3-phosphate acyltransferase
MMRQAKDAIARGSRIVIYPEGTRRPPLAPAQYRQGIVRMYVELGVPVVPVALNAGLFWGRNSLVIWPGTAEAKLLPPIEPGLPAQEFAARLRETIESESNNLILNAAREGLKRPLSTEMEHQLAALKTAHGTNNQN